MIFSIFKWLDSICKNLNLCTETYSNWFEKGDRLQGQYKIQFYVYTLGMNNPEIILRKQLFFYYYQKQY